MREKRSSGLIREDVFVLGQKWFSERAKPNAFLLVSAGSIPGDFGVVHTDFRKTVWISSKTIAKMWKLTPDQQVTFGGEVAAHEMGHAWTVNNCRCAALSRGVMGTSVSKLSGGSTRFFDGIEQLRLRSAGMWSGKAELSRSLAEAKLPRRGA